MKNDIKRWALGCASGCLLLAATLSGATAGTIKVGAIFAVTGPASFLGGPEATERRDGRRKDQQGGRHQRRYH